MDLPHKVEMENCKGVSTPLTSTVVFDPSPNDDLVDGSSCRHIIDKLHYLSFTRPNIVFAVSKLSQAMHQSFVSLGCSSMTSPLTPFHYLLWCTHSQGD